MHDVFIDFTVGKKWRELRDRGDRLTVEPWKPYLAAMREVYGDKFKVSEWTEAHVRHWVMKDWPIYWGAASCGKALTLDEPLMFPDHVGTFREVKVGSHVMAATGYPVEVVGVYDHFDHDLYSVKFSDGTETVCDADHLWTVKYRARVRWEGPRKKRKSVTGWRERTLSAKELSAWNPRTLIRRGTCVPLVKPLDFEKQQVPIDPYVIGCLLGDGSITSNVLLTSHPDDYELRDEVTRRLGETNPEVTLRKVSRDVFTYSIAGAQNPCVKSVFREKLKDLGLLGCDSCTKFIPTCYLINSIDVRRDVLSGLLDTDGCVEKNGRVTFTTVSRALAGGVRFLMESLGAYVTERTRKTTYTTGVGTKITGKRSYELCMHGLRKSEAELLFHLTRKRVRLRDASRRLGCKGVTSVTKIENRSDYPRETRCITLAETDVDGNPVNGLFPVGHFTVTHNSNDVGACVVPDWVIDPYDTTILIGSTTRPMLQFRVWESVLRYFGAFKEWAASHDLVLPGRVAQAGFSIVNDKDSGSVEDQSVKAGIHGVALDEGGKLQGAHMPYIRVVIDELATLKIDMRQIVDALTNLQVAKDFKFAAMANPNPWTDPSSSIFCEPVGGIESVSVDSREWDTTFGASVLHDDGLKSPCVLHPELAPQFPFLTQKKHLDRALAMSHGNQDSPSYWRMARGFPTPVGTEVPPILDPTIASRNEVTKPALFDPGRWRGTAVGIDPAWTEGGDGACRARCYLMIDQNGRTYLDFTGGLRRLQIEASKLKTRPALEQLMDQTVEAARAPYEADFKHTAVDSSGNQGLGSTLRMFAGAYDILEVNNADKASERPLIKFDSRPACDILADRGTEAWVTLARFCEAGMVRGLPEEALRALTTRRYAVDRDRTTGVVSKKRGKDRLEPKKDFKPRFGHSPDEADACALAALVIKEVYGILPFGYLDRPVRSIVQNPFELKPQTKPAGPVKVESFSARSDDCGDDGFDALDSGIASLI